MAFSDRYERKSSLELGVKATPVEEKQTLKLFS